MSPRFGIAARRIAALAGLAVLTGCASAGPGSVPVSPYPDAVFGLWSEVGGSCSVSTWSFEPETVAAPSGAACRVEHVWTVLHDTPVAAYDLVCDTETGAETRRRWDVTLQSDGALTLDVKDGSEARTLQRCGGPPPAASPERDIFSRLR